MYCPSDKIEIRKDEYISLMLDRILACTIQGRYTHKEKNILIQWYVKDVKEMLNASLKHDDIDDMPF